MSVNRILYLSVRKSVLEVEVFRFQSILYSKTKKHLGNNGVDNPQEATRFDVVFLVYTNDKHCLTLFNSF